MMTNFVGLRERGGSERARDNQRIIMGPWTHSQAGQMPPGTTDAGDRDFGFDSLLETRSIELAWFDHWLKGIDNGAEREPPVMLFLMGRKSVAATKAPGHWTAPSGPPTTSIRTGNANTLHGDGQLSPRRPPAMNPRTRSSTTLGAPGYRTMGGCNCCNPEIVPWGVYDQRPVEVRDDVLVYTTAPLTEDVEVTGPIVVHLFAATDGPDTDFTAKLVDVFPDGTAWNLCDGDRARPLPARPCTADAAHTPAKSRNSSSTVG